MINGVVVLYWRFNEHADVSSLSAEIAKYLNTVLYLALSVHLLAISAAASCESKQTPKNNRELPHYTGSTPTRRSFASFWAFCSFRPERRRSRRGDPPLRAARRKTAGAASGVRTKEGRRVAARRVGKAGRKSEGRPPSPLSSILDKNKVNGEWCCRRGGCCSAGGSVGKTKPGRTATGRGRGGMMLLSGRDVLKWKGKGKKYGDRCYRPREVQWRRSTWVFHLFASRLASLSRVSQGDSECD